MSKYEYPQKLIDMITDWESEGAEITITQGFDSTVFIADMSSTNGKWIVLLEWYQGSDDFNIVNLTEKAFERVHKIIHEMEDS